MLYSQGLSQTQAYREAFNKPRVKGNIASSRASEVARKPRVRAYVKSLFAALKKSDLISHAEYLSGLLEDLGKARDSGNWTAVSGLQRIIGQALGSLSENVTISDDRLTQEQLLERLGSNDPVLAERINRIVNAKRSFDA